MEERIAEKERDNQIRIWEHLNDAQCGLEIITTITANSRFVKRCQEGASTEIYRIKKIKSAIFSDNDFEKYSTMQATIHYMRKFLENAKMTRFRFDYGIAYNVIINAVQKELDRLIDEYTK